MATRFRKSVKIAPGVKLNLNKKSASVTVGGKYGRITKSTSGRTTGSASLPGTGIYYSTSLGGSSKQRETSSKEEQIYEEQIYEEQIYSVKLNKQELESLSNLAFINYRKGYLLYVQTLEEGDEDVEGATEQLRLITAEANRRVSLWEAQKEEEKKKQIKERWGTKGVRAMVVVLDILAVLFFAFMVWVGLSTDQLLTFLICIALGGFALVMAYKFSCLAEII